MGSNYENYNQAIAQEKQLQVIEKEVKPQVQEQLEQVESSENSYNKNLRSAVISNQKVDLKKATQTKQEYAQIKKEVKKPLNQIEQERSKINKLKSGVKTQDQLESQGYKKEIRGDQVIYYKEDTYKDRGKTRTYREEEYIFKSDGTPVKFIEREDFKRKDDDRDHDEEKVVQFDSQGRVTQVRTYDDGEKDEKINYSFNSDGSQSISTRDYAKERRMQQKAEKSSQNQSDFVQVSAELYTDGSSKYVETKNGVTTTTTYTKERTTPTQKVSSTRTLEATKTPTIETQLAQNVRNSLDLSVSENQQLSQTQTHTPEQIARQKNVESKAITGRDVTFSFTETKEGEVNLNPARLLIAPYQMGATAGSYIADNVKGKRSVVEDVSKGVETVKDQGVIKTVSNVVVGTLEHASKDPFGFTGEAVALGGAGKAVKQTVTQATTKIKPIEMSSRSVAVETSANRAGLGVEVVEVQGKVEVTQGVIKKKTRVVDVEGQGVINKETRALGAKDPDVSIVKENSVSREITPADSIQGEIKMSAEGQSTTVKVDGVRQGNKQITNVGKETFISETNNVAKLNGEDIFLTKTQNVKTGDLSVTTSKNVKSQGTTSPTQDAFATASQSQTDVFLTKKDLSSKPDKVVDVEATQTSKPLELTSQASDEIRITNLDELNAKRTTPKAEPTTSNQRDFSQGGQTQMFEQKVSQKQTSNEIASFETHALDDATNMFKSEVRSPTQVPISETTIKNVVTPKAKNTPKPVARNSESFSQTDLFSSDQGLGVDNISGQDTRTKQGQDTRTKTDVDTIQDPMRDSGFKQEIAQQTSQRNVQDQVVESPGVPPVNPPGFIKTPPKTDLDLPQERKFEDPFKQNQKRSTKSKGQFAGSLTALNQGIEVDSIDPNMKTSGLSKRAILRGRGF